jgi:hypothetical protein
MANTAADRRACGLLRLSPPARPGGEEDELKGSLLTPAPLRIAPFLIDDNAVALLLHNRTECKRHYVDMLPPKMRLAPNTGADGAPGRHTSVRGVRAACAPSSALPGLATAHPPIWGTPNCRERRRADRPVRTRSMSRLRARSEWSRDPRCIRTHRGLHPRMTGRMEATIEGAEIALVCDRWNLSYERTDGRSPPDCGLSAVVLRRRADGSWAVVIDDPWGGAQG